MKEYIAPEIQTVHTLAFETVCAKSGATVCAYGGFSEVDPYNDTCQLCFQKNNPNVYGFDDVVPSAQAGFVVQHYLQNKGNCPEGFSL